MSSPITIASEPRENRRKIEVERRTIYQPESAWTYSHHASITHFNGRFHAIWSNGHIHEDYPGQRILTASSSDFVEWSEPHPLIDTLQGKHSELILTAAGFHQYDGELIAYYGQYEYLPEALQETITLGKGHQDTSLWAVRTRDGVTWSAPQRVEARIVPNHGPQPTQSGRLIISGNISFPYTDDPQGLAGWQMTGIYPDSMAATIYDDAASFWDVAAEQGWPAGLCEGSFFQTDDGVLHMMLRTTGPGHDGRLWVSESRDGGATWSSPVQSAFTDNNTKFHFGRLPDGRFYYVGCPDATPRGARNPLVLALSDDGVHFGNLANLATEEYVMRREGRHKGGLYGYPHTMVHDGHLCVIISLRKEAVAVLRVAIADL